MSTTLPRLDDDTVRGLAVAERVCVRPITSKLTDTLTGDTRTVLIPCGSTRETVCPSCADKARRLRMQQCREGWHLTVEPVVNTYTTERHGDAPLVDVVASLEDNGDIIVIVRISDGLIDHVIVFLSTGTNPRRDCRNCQRERSRSLQNLTAIHVMKVKRTNHLRKSGISRSHTIPLLNHVNHVGRSPNVSAGISTPWSRDTTIQPSTFTNPSIGQIDQITACLKCQQLHKT
jgi:hypothetical protein